MKTGLFPPPGRDTDEQPYRRGNFDFACEWMEGVTSLDELLAHLDALGATDLGHRYLSTLDDINQCSYTCGHAGQDERLYLDPPDELNWDAPEQVAAWKLAGLQHIVQQLSHPGVAQGWTDVCGTLAVCGEDVRALVAINREPDQLLDDVVYVQRLPVATDDLMIAGQPNGYFSVDWDTFQNHAIIRHLAAHHGYRFFAMGASCMGFVRPAPPSTDQAGSLVAALRELYGQGQDSEVLEHEGWAELAQLLPTRRTLVLGYTEGFAESMGLDGDD